MIFDAHAYSTLVVSSAPKFDDIVRNLLSDSDYSPITFVSSISSAKQAIADRSYDLVIVNSPLPDDTGIRFAIDACGNSSTVALLIVKADILDEIHSRVVGQGVFTMGKPLNSALLDRNIKLLTAARERLRRLETKTSTVEQKMEEIRLVNRAKWILIEERCMTEDEAHHYIEKTAMDTCSSKIAIAQKIISESQQ